MILLIQKDVVDKPFRMYDVFNSSKQDKNVIGVNKIKSMFACII